MFKKLTPIFFLAATLGCQTHDPRAQIEKRFDKDANEMIQESGMNKIKQLSPKKWSKDAAGNEVLAADFVLRDKDAFGRDTLENTFVYSFKVWLTSESGVPGRGLEGKYKYYSRDSVTTTPHSCCKKP